MLRRFMAGFVVFGLLVAGCSSSGDDVSGPEVSLPTTTIKEPADEATTTVTTESLTGLENVLTGEPPSSTASANVDEQTAADVAHWNTQTFFECNMDPNQCDLTAFDEVEQGELLASTMDRFRGILERGESVLPDARDPESKILWARKSTTNPNVVGVLACERNYFVRVGAEGEIVNDSSPIGLLLWRVEKDDTGRFRVSENVTIDSYQPDTEGGDLCSEYDGTEVPDAAFEELTR